MKLSIRKVLFLDFEIDSSECIIFNKGGKQLLKMSLNKFDDDSGDENNQSFPDISQFTEIQISFFTNDSERYNRITEEAKRHRNQWDEINKEKSKPIS